MAFVLKGDALLRLSVQNNGATLSKFLPSSPNFHQFSRVKLRRRSLPSASAVQQQSETVTPQTKVPTDSPAMEFTGVHHVGVLCENLERSLDFYQGVLGLEINPDRPNDKLPYRGAWFWVGAEMIHIMELPNPDPLTGRPSYGGRDRHTCVALKSLDGLRIALEKAGIPFSQSSSGRAAIFARDPDGNCIEFTLA
jgi:glyoxylase I family protein